MLLFRPVTATPGPTGAYNLARLAAAVVRRGRRAAVDSPWLGDPEKPRGADVVGWLLFAFITLLCGLAAYIQCSGARQLTA
jgi:hypothetical protein